MRRIGIVATIGPASRSAAVLAGMVRAGLGYARLNFSHGTPAWHRRTAAAIRRAAGRRVAIIQDLEGPKVRLGDFAGTRHLRRGARVRLGTDFGITVPALLGMLRRGQAVYLDDGALELRVARTVGRAVECEVVFGGPVTARTGVAVPGMDLPLPALSDEDRAHVRIGREIGVEWVAQSMIDEASDVEELRALLPRRTKLIAKIETVGAVKDLAKIVRLVDGVMVARGDLGVSLPRAEVPFVQRQILETGRRAGVWTIVATEMLLSMVEQRRPTRAEVSDVVTAVRDGADAVMLSEETAIGRHPVRVIEEMRSILGVARRRLP